MIDLNDPKLRSWLLSLKPHEELAVRMAMRIKFPECRGDRRFGIRFEELMAMVKTSDDLLAIQKHAMALEGKIGDMLNEARKAKARSTRRQ